MPITKTPAFMTSDLNTYATLEIAQRAELLALLTKGDKISTDHANPVLQVLFEELDEVKEILRATGRKARKMNGAKKRKVLKPDKHGVVNLDKAGVSK